MASRGGRGRWCTGWESALSARLDGEDPGADARAIDAHLAACASCRDFVAASEALGRQVAALRAVPAPDLVKQILMRLDPASRAEGTDHGPGSW